MHLLADENIDFPIVQALREHGFQVSTILEQLRGVSDTVVLQNSVVEQAILITEGKDFGEHVFRLSEQFTGVILIRLPWNGLEERINLPSLVLSITRLIYQVRLSWSLLEGLGLEKDNFKGQRRRSGLARGGGIVLW